VLALAVNMGRLEKAGSWLFLSIISTGSGFFSGTDCGCGAGGGATDGPQGGHGATGAGGGAGVTVQQTTVDSCLHAVGTPSLKAPM
jgi:hypothetical protein